MKQNISILILEDNPDDVFLLKEALAGRDEIESKVFHAVKLSEALDLSQNNHIDVAILDLNLPDSFGIDTFLSFYEKNQQVPIIVMTGNNDRQLALNAVYKGAQDYLYKGEFSPAFIERTILYAIERNKLKVNLAEKTQQLKQANQQLKDSAQFIQSTLDGLAANIAVLNHQGTIIQVNKPWRDFAKDNGADLERVSDNINYFDICESADPVAVP